MVLAGMVLEYSLIGGQVVLEREKVECCVRVIRLITVL